MKKLIVIDTVLLLVFSIIPVNSSIETVAAPTEINKNISEVAIVEEISSRSLEEKRVEEQPIEEPTAPVEEPPVEEVPAPVEEIKKNLEFNIDSNLRILSNLSSEDFDKMLEGTALKGIGPALAQAEKEHGINGLYLLGLACLESSYGNSSFAKNRNNLVGWGAYDNNPQNAKYFSSKSECILYVANKLKTNYLSESGPYFNGYTATAINKKYSSDKKHAQKIVSIVNNLKNKI